MLVKCNPECRENNGMTDGSLDIDSNCVLCNDCGEEIRNISSYTKYSMKNVGDIVRRKARKAFTFPCEECGDLRSVEFLEEELVGKGCKHTDRTCKFSITENMINAVKINGEANSSNEFS
tara:strand:+ start:8002 stop:8361 length:360 start_codon:yes stop_codon:yes gene_type:complete